MTTEETLRERVAELDRGLRWIVAQVHEGHVNEGVPNWWQCMRGVCRTATRLLGVVVTKRGARR
jgi:hypothetical protein